MSATICGHERDVLIWALKLWSTSPNFAANLVDIRDDEKGPNWSATRHAALVATNDPAKLAELMASALRARGLDVLTSIGTNGAIGDFIEFAWWGQTGIVRDMRTVYKALLAIMQTTANKSSRETCERILRGDEFETPPEIPLRADSLEYVPRRKTSDPDEVA